MLIAMRDDGSVLLERRPESGIWGGLWCLPEFDTASAASSYVGHTLQAAQGQPKPLSTVEHAFTHFDLVITPLLTQCAGQAGVMDSIPTVWYNARDPARIGLPAPIKTLLDNLASPTIFDSSAPHSSRQD
jgi:A/G-specific adenine glycosylase